MVVYLIILLKMCHVLNDLPQSVISWGQRIARIGAVIMMSHVAVSPAGLGWAGLGWAGLLVGNPINHDTEEQREV